MLKEGHVYDQQLADDGEGDGNEEGLVCEQANAEDGLGLKKVKKVLRLRLNWPPQRCDNQPEIDS